MAFRKYVECGTFAHGFGADVEAEAEAEADLPSSPASVIFHPASGVDEAAVAQLQTTLRRRILRAFVGRGLLESCDAKDMLAYQHSGFSVDAGVCIEAHDVPHLSACRGIAPAHP